MVSLEIGVDSVSVTLPGSPDQKSLVQFSVESLQYRMDECVPVDASSWEGLFSCLASVLLIPSDENWVSYGNFLSKRKCDWLRALCPYAWVRF